jgi:hypothetical protein
MMGRKPSTKSWNSLCPKNCIILLTRQEILGLLGSLNCIAAFGSQKASSPGVYGIPISVPFRCSRQMRCILWPYFPAYTEVSISVTPESHYGGTPCRQRGRVSFEGRCPTLGGARKTEQRMQHSHEDPTTVSVEVQQEGQRFARHWKAEMYMKKHVGSGYMARGHRYFSTLRPIHP